MIYFIIGFILLLVVSGFISLMLYIMITSTSDEGQCRSQVPDCPAIPKPPGIPYTDGKCKKVTKPIKLPTKKYHNRKIEAISVSVGYHDFLRWSLPYNKAHFDKIVIVTTPEDIETQRICEYWHVECVLTNVFYEDGASFNKGKGINVGLDHLDKDGWVVHLDADIYLPPRTREILQLLPLDERGLYTIDRMNCTNFTEWIMFLEDPECQHNSQGLLHNNRFQRGARLLNLDRDGFMALGFFQLFHPNGSNVFEYPTEHTAADRSDVLFSYTFPREHRHLIPELVAVHLETVNDKGQIEAGSNWKGRITKRFSING